MTSGSPSSTRIAYRRGIGVMRWQRAAGAQPTSSTLASRVCAVLQGLGLRGPLGWARCFTNPSSTLLDRRRAALGDGYPRSRQQQYHGYVQKRDAPGPWGFMGRAPTRSRGTICAPSANGLRARRHARSLERVRGKAIPPLHGACARSSRTASRPTIRCSPDSTAPTHRITSPRSASWTGTKPKRTCSPPAPAWNGTTPSSAAPRSAC